jgi:hypothetical protein
MPFNNNISKKSMMSIAIYIPGGPLALPANNMDGGAMLMPYFFESFPV